jgi:peptide/nickel transport system permease protein
MNRALAISVPRIRIRYGAVIGAIIIVFFVLSAFAPGLVAPMEPNVFDFKALLQPPSLAHPFGTDQFGRDVLSRTIWAAQIDLQIAVFGTVPPLIVGTLVGLLVGYLGGIADIIFGRAVDFIMTFPFMIIVIATVAVLGPGLVNMYIAVAAFNWIFYARLMRNEVIVHLQQDYVAAGHVLGFSPARILLRHVFPNSMRTVLVYWITDMALVILLGSSLSYLGLGAQPPTAEWGALAADGKNFFSQAPWISFFPGCAVVLCGFGFSLLGDAVSDWMDARR